MRLAIRLIILVLFLSTQAPAWSQENSADMTQVIDVDPAWSGHSVGYCLLTHEDHQYVSFYDHNKQLTVAMRKLNSTEWTFKRLPEHVNWDSHHYITMSMDRDGQLHVSGNMHSDPLVYFRTTKPHDISTLRREKSMTGNNEKKCTYPQFIKNAEGDLPVSYTHLTLPTNREV